MPSAEIITIGTEILLGEILDTNAQFIARKFRDVGIDLYRKTTVGDNAGRIVQVIQQSMERCDIILTTGGLGPTVDDPTRDAIALAVGKKTEFRPELWEQIQARFQRFGREPTENNKRQAYIPEGAIPVENPMGTAPAFIVEHTESQSPPSSIQSQVKTIIALPGVPREMEYLLEHAVLPYLRQRYQLTGIIKARLIHTVGIGESQIDDMIGELETSSNPTVGLAAHSGQVDVRITAKAESEAKADELIGEVEKVLRVLLSSWIYGVDQETLEEAALQALHRRGWTLATVESGLSGSLIRRLSIASQNWEQGETSPFRGGEVITELPTVEELSTITANCREKLQVEVSLGVAIYPRPEKQDVCIVLITPSGRQEFIRPFGGPPEYAPRWALHHSLDIIRKI
jgi:competence/damage-inducible protein CinA-like protein